MFKRILIANRGEIAVRVIRACRDLGVETVAVFSEADRTALHVREADYAVAVGPPPAAQSYLNIANGFSTRRSKPAPKRSIRATAFFPRTRDLRARSPKAGLVFIGPPPSAIEHMGDKVEARKLMAAAGVPVVPGSPGTLETRGGSARLSRKRSAFRSCSKRRRAAAARACGWSRMKRIWPRRCGRSPAKRSPRSATAAFTSRNSSTAHAISRCRSSPIRQGNTVHRVRARMFDSAAQSEGGRGIALAVHYARDARDDGRSRGQGGARGELCRCRHDRVSGRRRSQFLLPGNEHAHPGRASGDRTGDRDRSGEGADRSRRGRSRCRSSRAIWRSADGRSNAAFMPRIRRRASFPRREDRQRCGFPTVPACASTRESMKAPKSRSFTIR